EGTSRMGAEIHSVIPGTVVRGRTHTIRIVLNSQAARGQIPSGKPSWVQFGPFEAAKIDRQGDAILAEIAIPKDASLGVLLDGHIEFGAAGGSRVAVLKKNEALRIVE